MNEQKTTVTLNNPHLKIVPPTTASERMIIITDALRGLHHLLSIADREDYLDLIWLVKPVLNKIETIISGVSRSHNMADVDDLRVMMEGTIWTMKLSNSDAPKMIAPLLELVLRGLDDDPIL